MNLPTKDIKRIVSVSNQVAEYPPLDLTKLQYQALLILISCIDSTEKPVYGIEDIVEEIKSRSITDQYEQMQYLEEVINRQNTYRIPYKEYLRYFTGGETPQGGVIQRAVDAVLSLNNKPFKFNNPEYEGSYVWLQAVALDKKNNDIVFVITSYAKPFLIGLRRDFLQMLAESTISFDGKYSVPIFLYMKSRLFEGRTEYHGGEPLDTFKRRFGLENIKTYEKFYDFQRRILEVAEKDSERSGDIKFVFTGKSESGSKKVTDLQYSIYRTGSIKNTVTKAVTANRVEGKLKINDEITKKRNNEITKSTHHKEKLMVLSESQRKAYVFLADLSVNKAFIVDKILSHHNFNYPLLRGYEDIYLKMLWDWFVKKTKSEEKAPAFVSWWKNGRLTREDIHWRLVELLRQKLKNQEKKQPTIFNQVVETGNTKQANRLGEKLLPFNVENFQKDHPSVYQQIAEERHDAFAEFKDLPNFQQMLNNSITSHCEQWWRKHE